MSSKLKPNTCMGCPLYEQNVFVPGGHTKSKVIVMSDCPPNFGGHFSGRGATLLKGVIRELALEESESGSPGEMYNFYKECQYMYSTLCHSESLKKKEIEYCRDSQIMGKISNSGAKVILCLGKYPATFFGLSKISSKDLRGRIQNYTLPNGKTIKLVFTISLDQLLDNPGLYSVLTGDIKRAAKVLQSSLTPKLDIFSLTDVYDIATELSDIKEIAKEYSTYTEGKKAINQTLMSLDTETNTLFPWWDESRIISFSAGFNKNKACSFLVDHRQASFSLEDVLPYLLKITCSEHVKAWWNYKFDLQMFMALFSKTKFSKGLISDIERETGLGFQEIKKCYGIRNTRCDGLLFEHLLDESKKGYYSLKDVIADYRYELFGYEEPLDIEKSRIASERKSNIEVELLETKIGDLCSTVYEFDPKIPLSRFKEHYESKKKLIQRKIKRAKSTLNTSMLDLHSKKLDKIMSDYREIKKSAEKGIKELTSSYYVSKPRRAGLPSLYTYEDINVDLLLLYGAIDAAGTVDICKEQRRKLHKEDKENAGSYLRSTLSLMDRHCLPSTVVLAHMQYEGVFTDPSLINKYKKSLEIDISETESKIYGKIESDFPFVDSKSINLNSSSSLGNILVGWYGLPVLEETDTGQPSFKANVLKRYSEEYGCDIAYLITDYNNYCSARDKFVLGIEEMSLYDQRLHGSILLNGTATGRSSSSNPNLQNLTEQILNYKIKSLVRATPIHEETWPSAGLPRSYYLDKYNWSKEERLVLIDADLSGAEVKIMTCFAPDKDLIDALKNGLDAHSWLTSEVHGVPYEEIEAKRNLDTPRGKELSSLRGRTKALVFKILYGGEPEDKALKNLVFDRFPGIPKYLDETKREVYNNQRVYTPNGRCRRFPMVRIADWAARRMYRQAINFGIQSYCSDVVFNMLTNIYNTLPEIRGRLLLTVHDSVVFECPSSEIDKVGDYLKRNITDHIASTFPDIPVPMPFGYKVGYNYGEMVNPNKWHKEKTLN